MKQRLLVITFLMSPSLYPAHVDLTAADKAEVVSRRLALKKGHLVEKEAELFRLKGSLALAQKTEALNSLQLKMAQLTHDIAALIEEIPILELSLKALDTLTTNGK